MSTPLTINEVDFCSQIASTANGLIAENREAYPFREVLIEGYGTGAGKRKRKDLRFIDFNGKVILCGEVKLPGTKEGRSAFADDLMQDACTKADNAGVKHFFTWNVNEFVLFDRSLWDKSLIDRRLHVWRLPRILASPQDVAREENLNLIKKTFLPNLLREIAEILSGRHREGLPPDDIFIRSLESHLNWPVQLISRHIIQQAEHSKAFSQRVQEWMTAQDWTFVTSPHDEWVKVVDNMAKTLSYVWANRLIFYKALRARFPDLPRLDIRRSVKKPANAVAAFNQLFEKAVERSGDYESLLMPDAKDWATVVVFHPENAIDAWRGLINGIELVDFRQVSSDVVGRIFQKLIGPEERHRYGQHFTGDDAVDLINVFCIREGSDAILDPACGSGSFLVRAYYRKRHLNPARTHLDLIGELFGCDISLYPAHLATLNVAAREINDEANYPRIARRSFFDFTPSEPFCLIPDDSGGKTGVMLPRLEAVVGNPPYVRQEKIDRDDKRQFGVLASNGWPGLRLGGRSDLHCYFWPVATKLLKDDGYFGFLTSSSWLDVEYGFALQGWALQHFRILAVLESAAEPWFEDARVKTCVTILQRCDDPAQRMGNLVRFVRFTRKLADIIGIPPGEKEDERQAALEALREHILITDADRVDQSMRIIVKKQSDLWADGVRAGQVLAKVSAEAVDDDSEEADDAAERETDLPPVSQASFGEQVQTYRAGKWGRYLRAPDIYFEIMRRFRERFVPLGEIADIRFGVKTGCDAFFMPRDVSASLLALHEKEREFREYAGGAPRKDVESGKLTIIKAGDETLHPIESKYLKPEVHSLMKVDRPVVRAIDIDRLVLLVGEPMDKLKTKSPWVWHYLRYGMSATFASRKSRAVPVPERSTCEARDPWYDLTGLVRPGIAFWPMAQQYRHIIASNPERLICNHNMFDIAAPDMSQIEADALVAILNSTFVGLFKTFYGRYAGTEGNLKTEVVDVNLLEVPDPRGVSADLAKRLAAALDSMCQRDVGRLVEEQLMDCHTPDRARRIAAGKLVLSNELCQLDRRQLDEAVLELLGVSSKAERKRLIDQLYEATARHFRDIRVVEIEKMQQRAKSDKRRFSVQDLAADIWDAAELDDAMPLAEWVEKNSDASAEIDIPDERPVRLAHADDAFSPNTIYFGRSNRVYVDCPSRGQAELVAALAEYGVGGKFKGPSDNAPSAKLLVRVQERMERAVARFKELADSRTGDERVREQLVEVLQRWFVLGREQSRPGNSEASALSVESSDE